MEPQLQDLISEARTFIQVYRKLTIDTDHYLGKHAFAIRDVLIRGRNLTPNQIAYLKRIIVSFRAERDAGFVFKKISGQRFVRLFEKVIAEAEALKDKIKSQNPITKARKSLEYYQETGLIWQQNFRDLSYLIACLQYANSPNAQTFAEEARTMKGEHFKLIQEKKQQYLSQLVLSE